MADQHQEKLEAELDQIVEAVQGIEKMLQAVRTISTKTDLLALNASIEAARAGQAGKGFAVVADEVARLAEKSQDSIGSIEVGFGSLRDRILSLENLLLGRRSMAPNEAGMTDPTEVA